MAQKLAKVSPYCRVFIFLFAHLVGLGACSVFAQKTDDSVKFPQGLTAQLWTRNPNSLRDIATYLDDPAYTSLALATLNGVTAFTESEFDFSKPTTKQAFFNFFYTNKNRIYFDPTVGLYLCTPLENQASVDFSMLVLPKGQQRNKESLEFLFKNVQASEKSDDFDKKLQHIQDYNSPESWNKLLVFCKALKKNDYTFDPFPAAARALRFCPDIQALQLVEKWIKTAVISPQDAEIPLSELLNTYVPSVQKDSMLLLISKQSAGITTMAEVKQKGYAALSGLSPSFFEDSIDYLGVILAESGAQPWVSSNLLFQLRQSKQPKALFYLAAEVWRRRQYLEYIGTNADRISPILTEIEAITQSRILVQTGPGQTSAIPTDNVWFFNYLKYWAVHQNEYIWDDVRGHFINKNAAETVEELARTLFQRLNSTSDSIAQSSFMQLTSLDTDLVLALADEYRNYATPTNPSLPPFRLPFLGQMTKLTDLCEAFDRPWLGDEDIKSQVDFLLNSIEPSDRLRAEDALIENLPIEKLTILEYAALLHANNTEFSISTSRILDKCYAKYWNKIIENPDELRFFLLKSALFQGIGTHGTCNKYETFLQKNPKQSQLVLQKMKQEEPNSRVSSVIDKTILALNETTVKADTKPLASLNKDDFDALLQRLTASASMEASEVNSLFKSKFFNVEQDLPVILQRLDKLPETSQLLLLDFPVKLSASKHLAYFERLDLDNRTLGQLTRVFSEDSPEIFFHFYKEKTKEKVVLERGHILTQALSVHWMISYLMESAETTISDLEWTKMALKDYQNEADYLSEFEENQLKFLMLLFDTKGKPLSQKLENALINGSSYRIEQDLLAYANWSDLPTLCLYLESLHPSPDGKPGFWFLNRDFGLPPLNFDQLAICQAYFPEGEEAKPEMEVYRNALIKFGYLKENKPELPQIYSFLETERIAPFVGGGGFYRDWCVFAAVKILENQFHENFGYHEKLNENQTFYIYNSGARAKAWVEYLEKNKLVDSGNQSPTWQ